MHLVDPHLQALQLPPLFIFLPRVCSIRPRRRGRDVLDAKVTDSAMQFLDDRNQGRDVFDAKAAEELSGLDLLYGTLCHLRKLLCGRR
jgi:hypothetical protein